RRVAVSITDSRSGNVDVWSYDTSGGIPTRLTTDPAIDGTPVWSPDGKHLVYSSMRRGLAELFDMSSRGEGDRPLSATPPPEGVNYPTDWDPDGRQILYRRTGATTNLELWLTPPDGGNTSPFLKAPYGVTNGRFSPDGRFVAYASNESGRWEIYVAPFPGP